MALWYLSPGLLAFRPPEQANAPGVKNTAEMWHIERGDRDLPSSPAPAASRANRNLGTRSQLCHRSLLRGTQTPCACFFLCTSKVITAASQSPWKHRRKTRWNCQVLDDWNLLLEMLHRLESEELRQDGHGGRKRCLIMATQSLPSQSLHARHEATNRSTARASS